VAKSPGFFSPAPASFADPNARAVAARLCLAIGVGTHRAYRQTELSSLPHAMCPSGATLSPTKFF
jgi:hypothetical protein